MKQIERVQTQDEDINSLQTNILAVINPLLRATPLLFATTIKNKELKIGTNSINTGLNQAVQGWVIIRQRGQANIYDVQDSNPAPNSTLSLVSDSVVTVDLIVF